MWEVRIQHEGLRARRVLKGPTQADAQWKATSQLLLWEARWNTQQKANQSRLERQSRQMLALHGRATAAALTTRAIQCIAALASILQTSLDTGLFLHWDLLKDHSAFAEPPVLPEPTRTPPPYLFKTFYAAQLSFFDKLLPWRRKRKEVEATGRFNRDLAAWQAFCQETNWRAALDFQRRTAERERNRLRHLAAQIEQHAKVEETRAAFELRDREAVEYFFSELLSRSSYPQGFPEDATLQYLHNVKTLIVEYELPSIAAWPTGRHVIYRAERNRLDELPHADAWLDKSYKDALYQITLRALHELFAHDYAHALDSIAFNGWVRSIDKATGNMVHARLISIQVTRLDFNAINLTNVDPKSCFRRLKGVIGRNPLALTPIQAVLSLYREDSRFIDPRSGHNAVEEQTAGDQRIASMRRSDFENLIREAFEREFRKNRAQLTVAQTEQGLHLDA